MAGHHRQRRADAAIRLHAGEGIRRTRMADRYRDRRGVGRVRGELLRDVGQTPRAPLVRGALVLYRVDRDRRRAAHLQQPVDPGWPAEELQHLCRRTGRVYAVVVRTQRRRLLPHDAVPRPDVLLHAESGGRAGVLVQTIDSALLVAGFHVHLGRPAPPALHGAARMGLNAGHALFGDALGPVLGRHDQRPAHVARGVAQGGAGSDPEILCRRDHRVRHVDVRGPDALDQERQCARALHRLDHRARAHRRPRLERLHDVRHGVLAAAAPLPDRDLQQARDGSALLDRVGRHRAVCRRDL